MMAYLKSFLSLGFNLSSLLPLIGAAAGTAFGNPAAGYAIGSGVKGAIGGQQGGSKNSNAYVPTGLGGADQTFQSVLQQLAGGSGGAAGQITPELAKAFGSLLGIDTSGLTQGGAQAGQMYGALAPQAQQAGQYLTNQGMDVGNAGQQAWLTSLDPQNDLRNKLQQQVVDASRAGTSARGIGMGGEAAGLENKSVTDFLMNWNNQQLQRQLSGLAGYAGASNQAGRDIAGGLGTGAMGADFANQSGQVPFATNVQARGFPMQAAGMYNSALGGVNQNLGGVLSAIIPYLNNGLGATGQAFNQGQVGMNNLTTGLQQFGFGNGSGGGGGNAGSWFSGLFGASPSAGSGSSGSSFGGAENPYFPYGGGT